MGLAGCNVMGLSLHLVFQAVHSCFQQCDLREATSWGCPFTWSSKQFFCVLSVTKGHLASNTWSA